MIIGLFTDSYMPSHDGVATSVSGTAQELNKLGHKVYIIAPSHPNYRDRKNVLRILSVQIYQEPEIRIGLDIPQPSLIKISEIPFDIIHGHSGGPVSLLGWQIAQIRNIPFVETYHTMWRQYAHYFPFPHLFTVWTLKRLSSIFGNDSDCVIAPSERAKDELISYGVKKPIYIIPSGIHAELFHHQKKGFLHQQFNLKEKTQIALFVGRLEQEKSPDFLITSFTHVVKQRPEAVLILVGSGREKETLQKLSEDLNIAKNVFFMEPVNYLDMPKVYADSELLVFSSKTETQGLVILEALTSGIPVVAVQDRVSAEIIKNGENGFLVDKDPEAFAQKIVKVLKDVHLQKKLSENAKESSKLYSIETQAKSLEEVYTEQIVRKNAVIPTKKFLPRLLSQLFAKNI